MASISAIKRRGGAKSYMVSFNRPDGRKTTKTFRDRSEAEAFADQHGGWGRGRTGPIPRPPAVRHAEKVEQRGPDDCWPWRGPIKENGYGYMFVSDDSSPNRKEHAHRLAWEFANGRPVPAGLVVRHTCDNRRCVNPRHLLVGTQLDNMRDMKSRKRDAPSRRTHCVNGHEFSSENTRLYYAKSRNGVRYRTRICRECERASGRRKALRAQREVASPADGPRVRAVLSAAPTDTTKPMPDTPYRTGGDVQ